MDAYKVYNHVKKGHEEVLKMTEEVIQLFERTYGFCFFPPFYNSLMKLNVLLENGYGGILWLILEKLGYSYEFEIQEILATMDSLLRNNMSVIASVKWTCYYSMHSLTKLQDCYVLDTKAGTLITTPLTEWKENLKMWEYANRRGYYGFCHDAVERFLKENLEYQAVTSLIPHQFGRKHYHSYIKHEGKILDLSHNACIDEETYNKIMNPIPLNQVYGYELESEERKLGSDELGPEKCLLVRLAVAKQRRG